jgi:hypothetical protein
MAEDVAHGTPEGKFYRTKGRWIMSADLAQSQDYTALCVMENVHGILDFNTDEERHCGIMRIPHKKSQELYVKHLERLPLGLPYPQINDRIAAIYDRPPLCGYPPDMPRADLVVDDTGVGRAVSDMLVERGLKPRRVTITAGLDLERCVGTNRWHVSKDKLITRLDALLNDKRIKFAAELTESSALKNELIDFRRTVSGARATYAARTGQHDDLVLAVAIAAWWATRPATPTAQFSTYSWTAPPTHFSTIGNLGS